MTSIRNGLMVLGRALSASFSALSLANEEYGLSIFADALGDSKVKSKDMAVARDCMCVGRYEETGLS